ncbi:hypothetical protein BDA99DRAFT_566429 [Phascolomyces articulosus]|uniref:Yeast cell wall synthesis Kre9/Knh1-like N-terminal domain-containing protein n=1 Tax=Phascolomyces articulosus TaxID=60185 RepID=A0AAD5P7G7_9FUNG|nr:hypothetical protein BDA99DRAFT_566429 [Phascolomyces articulosus]
MILFTASAYSKPQEGCSVMVPMKGTIWKTGQMVSIRWSGINDKSISAITLAQPTEEGGYIDVAKVASEVPAQPGKYSIKLPANIVPNDNYVVILGNSETAKCEDTAPIVPQNPVAPGNELQPTSASATILPSNVGTPASSTVAEPLVTESYNTPSNDGKHNDSSRTVGHGAMKSQTVKSNASNVDRKSGLLSYFLSSFLIIGVVIEITH